MGYDLHQVGGRATWSCGLSSMESLRLKMQQADAVAPEYPFDRDLKELYIQMEAQIPKPIRAHFTRHLRCAKTDEARSFHARLYAGVAEILARGWIDDNRPPINKFIGNNGSHVTPVECRTLLSNEKLLIGLPVSFIKFLQEVVNHGFTVD